MLVTFMALVPGLEAASVKMAYDDAGHDLQEHALKLTPLDRCMRNYESAGGIRETDPCLPDHGAERLGRYRAGLRWLWLGATRPRQVDDPVGAVDPPGRFTGMEIPRARQHGGKFGCGVSADPDQ
jgi:hypothetical protein